LLERSARVPCVTNAARGLLESVTEQADVPSDLRSLRARCAMAGAERSVVLGVACRDGGRVLLSLAAPGPLAERSTTCGSHSPAGEQIGCKGSVERSRNRGVSHPVAPTVSMKPGKGSSPGCWALLRLAPLVVNEQRWL